MHSQASTIRLLLEQKKIKPYQLLKNSVFHHSTSTTLENVQDQEEEERE